MPRPASLASLVVTVAGLVAASVEPRSAIVRQSPSSRPVRVLLATLRDDVTLRLPVAWQLIDSQRRVIARGQPDEAWLVQRDSRRLRLVRPDGTRLPWYDGRATLELPDTSGYIPWNGRRYRGQMYFVPVDSALLLVNRLDVEDYLRGVVPLEAGTSATDAHAAVEAQAVAARSFTYTRMLYAATRDYDLSASTNDQVYGGAEVETFIGDLAVAATAGWVLAVGGRVVTAPYHSTCGGSTAHPSEVWRASAESYLQSVSDRIPGTDRYYCDRSPRFRWVREIEAGALAGAAQRFAAGSTSSATGPIGAVRDVTTEGRTTSGRVSAIVIVTGRTRLRVTGDEIRSVLRGVGGELLPSTYFSLEPLRGASGGLSRLVVRGQGNGHGVGMCQWGAIGRARAGQDFRAILRGYYPGAQLMRAP